MSRRGAVAQSESAAAQSIHSPPQPAGEQTRCALYVPRAEQLHGQPVANKTIKVSEMPAHPAGLKEAKHYKKMMEWYSKVEDPDGKSYV